MNARDHLGLFALWLMTLSGLELLRRAGFVGFYETTHGLPSYVAGWWMARWAYDKRRQQGGTDGK